ncbi:MAG: hypothetical protein LBC18_03035 [Opitutaceae bacterium]|jgi:hypothetical protein|nr:hypothetical protein [Opitutaceae bacterium]
MDNLQTNTKVGVLTLTAVGDLTGKEGLLAGMYAGGVRTPDGTTDPTPYVIIDGNPAPGQVTVLPLSPDTQVRILAEGAIGRGKLVTTAASAVGRIRQMPTSGAGTYPYIGIAEEDGVDGQAVLIRPWGLGNAKVIPSA